MIERLLSNLRDLGYLVAVHNEYVVDGVVHAFWLFTNTGTGRFVKGEGITNGLAITEALATARRVDA